MDGRIYLRSLLEYNAWANDELGKKVRELPPEEVTKKRETVLESIHLSLNHLLTVDIMWHAHMERRQHGISELRAVHFENLDDFWPAREAMDRKLISYLDDLSNEALEEVVEYELIGGNKGEMSRAMCLSHLATHGSYHRGWIADMFGQAGCMPAVIDIPVYARAVKEKNLNPLP
jgi:uncharacterized damage-inducible protein DinB